MRTARVALTLAVALLITSSLSAAEKKARVKAPPKCPAADRVDRMLAGLTLTDDQKAKLGEITKECGPKMVELQKKIDSILTDDQKKARAEAMKTAKAEGKTGKEAANAVDAALKMTDDQKAKMAEARKEMSVLDKGLRGKVMEVLTAEQKEELKKKAPKPAKPQVAK